MGNHTLTSTCAHQGKGASAGARQRIALGLCGQQALCIGMLRARFEYRFCVLPAFHDSSGLHDRDLLGHLAHDAEIVRDEQHRHAELLACSLP